MFPPETDAPQEGQTLTGNIMPFTPKTEETLVPYRVEPSKANWVEKAVQQKRKRT